MLQIQVAVTVQQSKYIQRTLFTVLHILEFGRFDKTILLNNEQDVFAFFATKVIGPVSCKCKAEVIKEVNMEVR